MRLNINLQILSMVLLVCFSCQSASNKTASKSQEVKTIAATSEKKVVRKLKYNDHCLVYNPGDITSLKFEKSQMYYPAPNTIDNNGAYVLTGSNPAISLYSNGANWFVF